VSAILPFAGLSADGELCVYRNANLRQRLEALLMSSGLQ
jgi:hypothetical protein